MHLAALYDHAHIIEILHEHGADVDHTNNHHMTPLHYASRSNDIESVQSLLGKELCVPSSLSTNWLRVQRNVCVFLCFLIKYLVAHHGLPVLPEQKVKLTTE